MSRPLPATPFLALDLPVLDANIERVAAWADKREVLLRPHVKTHKSPEVAHRQLDAGASGITVATIGEAEVFVQNGFENVFIAYAGLVGQTNPTIKVAEGTPYRTYRAGDPVTSDFSLKRLNFEYDRSGKLLRVTCG